MTLDFFYEKAFWGFLALFALTVKVIYKLYSELQDADLTLKIKECEDRFEKEINFLKNEINKIKVRND